MSPHRAAAELAPASRFDRRRVNRVRATARECLLRRGSRLSELIRITEQVKRHKQALGEFVQRCYEKPRELTIPRQTFRGACQRDER
jgi:hypothetical protein